MSLLPARVRLDATTECQVTADPFEVPQNCVKVRWRAIVRGATFRLDGQVLDDGGDPFNATGWLLSGGLWISTPMSADSLPEAEITFEWTNESLGEFRGEIAAEDTWLTEGEFWKIDMTNDSSPYENLGFVQRLCSDAWNLV